jgi:putative methyltransferase (TIGR04325 family)
MNRDFVRQLLPPPLFRLVRQIRNRAKPLVTGDYATFADAEAACGTGYESSSIIDDTVERFRESFRENAPFLDELSTARPAIELSESDERFITSIGAAFGQRRHPNRFRVIDFGGQMGGHYVAARRLLPPEVHIDWTVVETPASADAGNRFFARRGLSFTANLAEAPRDEVDLVYSSGTILHLPDPYQTVRELLDRDVSWLVLDRLPLTDWPRDRIAIQPVTYKGVRSAYPFRILREAEVIRTASEAGFDARLKWTLRDHEMLLDGKSVWFRGIQFARRAER